MNKKQKKEVREWAIFIVIIGVLYFTGWYRPVIGTIQRGILMTGIFQPSVSSENINFEYDLILTDSKGNMINLEDHKGKTLFINFWATWCAPCIAEMPDINQLYLTSKDDATFFMISVDDNEQKAQNFIEKKEFAFPVYHLRSSLPQTFNASTIPTTYVISPQGKIIVERHGMAKYNTEKFKSLLKSP